jgi:tetratricopeptide (TPR) repeat protein
MVALLIALLVSTPGAGVCVEPARAVDEIRDERVRGSLVAAESRARELLDCGSLDPADELEARIELARILDRQGLHRNTRPVSEALAVLREAESKLNPEDERGQATLQLALAAYFYRAEMEGRRFDLATRHAGTAMESFRVAQDVDGEVDAVHLLGLIALQQGDLKEARDRFDQSLERSRAVPERLIFLSDYHRHVALVELRSGERSPAIDHLRESLALRDRAGSRDYGLFARTLLGSVLADGGELAEAGALLEEALEFARDLPSPVGEMRAAYLLGRVHELSGRIPEAKAAYQRALELAVELSSEGMRNAADESLQGLASRGGTAGEPENR